VLEALNGNKSLASQTLGLDRKTLYRKLQQYGVSTTSVGKTAEK
jgi:transcriptional regulator of acetoin/glycerol metabolism